MIYQSILLSHYSNAEQKFNMAVVKMAENIIAASLALHAKVSLVFLPTAIKFHYVFNLRDLSNVFQGLLFTTNDCLVGPSDMVSNEKKDKNTVMC